MLTAATIAAEVAAAQPAPADASALLQPILARHQLPGLVALALRGETIVAQGAVGVRQAGHEERVTLEDEFHLGSATKAMTGTLIGLLVDEGKLKWTATLGEIFGDTIRDMKPAWQGVTLQQVLAHRAGLPANPGKLRRAWAFVSHAALAEQRFDLVESALSHEPESPPGSKFVYSNTGYILLGAIVEKITGQPWETAMQERLFAPLAIVHGGFGPPGAPDRIDQPWGHNAEGKPVAPDAHGADNPAFYGPAGTCHMPVREWAKFVSLHLRGDPANPHRAATLLKPETVARLHSPEPEGDYMAGWVFATRVWADGPRPGDGGRTFWHNGTNTVWFCITWVAPEIDFAVLIACNQGGEAAAKACDEVAGELIKNFSQRK